MVHVGLGAFHRAHQAWWTAAVDDEWGIAAFTGRRPDLARALAEQDGLYTLIERRPDGDLATVVPSIARAVDGADLLSLARAVADPATAVITLTVTEAGYSLLPDGRLDERDGALQADWGGAPPRTVLGRLAFALDARRRADSGPLAIVPCDNLPGNGEWLARGMREFAARRGDGLEDWIVESASFVSTSVDRITPRFSKADPALAERLTGYADAVPVTTEPFHDWVLSGEFPAGRPRWEDAGARFVDDIVPYERRKLWLLNGAHSLLAYLGILRGHVTVADAVADPVCRGAMSELWMDARAILEAEHLELAPYCDALRSRFANPLIRHELAQIAMGGAAKLRARVVPAALARRAEGSRPRGCALAIAAWAVAVRSGLAGADPESSALEATGGELRGLVRVISPELADDVAFLEAVGEEIADIGESRQR
jgi:fructuronate reductase